ncbi:hypothetical protein GDO78_002285 [Eleutherodactylus coqui]|uniref:Uncharacterized protein n=1 Tax=Eleutherodactylus coqui TaxID=57060 RepID=A0A8J6EWQ0_ELECQ|nr:hypothetical protein GDO78_002285 [Eleutherodactylus coqui]
MCEEIFMHHSYQTWATCYSLVDTHPACLTSQTPGKGILRPVVRPLQRATYIAHCPVYSLGRIYSKSSNDWSNMEFESGLLFLFQLPRASLAPLLGISVRCRAQLSNCENIIYIFF